MSESLSSEAKQPQPHLPSQLKHSAFNQYGERVFEVQVIYEASIWGLFNLRFETEDCREIL